MDWSLLLFGTSLLPALVSHGCKQFSEALKHPWVPTFVPLGGVLLNVLLNWVLIYGHWGAPAMGLEGAALAFPGHYGAVGIWIGLAGGVRRRSAGQAISFPDGQGRRAPSNSAARRSAISRTWIDATKKIPGEGFNPLAAARQDGCRGEGEGGKTLQPVAADVRRLKLKGLSVLPNQPIATRLRCPSISARAYDGFLLHMQQSFAQSHSGLKVRSCRLASWSTSTRRRHACCPR